MCIFRRVEILRIRAISIIVAEVEMKTCAEFCCYGTLTVGRVQIATRIEMIEGNDRVINPERIGHVESVARQLDCFLICPELVVGNKQIFDR